MNRGEGGGEIHLSDHLRFSIVVSGDVIMTKLSDVTSAG